MNCGEGWVDGWVGEWVEYSALFSLPNFTHTIDMIYKTLTVILRFSSV